jgi:hypothetical protein
VQRDAPGSTTRPRRRAGLPLRTLVRLVLGLALAVAAWLAVGRGGDWLRGLPALSPVQLEERGSPGKSRFLPLSAADRELLQEQRWRVDALARRHVGAGLTGRSLEDLRILQEILDRAPPAPDETRELQALGVALGDVMAAQLGLSWVVFEDELGRSRALRLGGTDVVVFPVTMISKRVERDVPFRVEELYRKALETVRDAVPGA